ncbi:LacI family DNA-binding transcriptional regulator [Phytohabitans aurantiacus]|nr:LacI family DNA-binding transcriptional regulator [Phytohabitans aurantiacus]
MPATMHDVAKLAGVSVKTVSNVLSGYPYIRETTKAKVLAAVDELGYRMNISARNLRAGRTGLIGLAVPELSLPYFGELADAVIRAAEERSWTVLVEQTGADREREVGVLSGARRQLVDGLIFAPLTVSSADIEQFRGDFPIVLLGERTFDVAVDNVTIGNVDAARTATAHLIETGRRRIAAIGTHPTDAEGPAVLRLEGYLAALREAGIEPDAELIVPAGLWHRAEGAAAMRQLLEAGTRFDAAFCFNDTLALGAMYAVLRHGLRVPEDIAIVGFDDIEDAQYSMPPLSSIAPGREQIARAAVDLLAKRIEEREHPHQQVVADFELRVRESTAG